MSDNLALSVTLKMDYEDALVAVTAALQTEGFGVLTEIDVAATFKKKLDLDFRRYKILGACNPPLANRALNAEALVGLMLPCNVTVEETEDGGTLVNFLNPKAMMHSHPLLSGNEALIAVGNDAYDKLKRVAESLK